MIRDRYTVKSDDTHNAVKASRTEKYGCQNINPSPQALSPAESMLCFYPVSNIPMITPCSTFFAYFTFCIYSEQCK